MSSAGRTHWMLEEVGVPYEYHRIDVRNPESHAKLLTVSPAGKIPFIIDGDMRLSESCAINFYLAERYKPELLPTDLRGRAMAHQWAFWAMTNLQPEALKVMFAFMDPTKTKPEELASTKQTVQKLMDHFESQLGTYLIDDELSVADVIAGSVINLTMRVNAATAGPKTTAWMEALRARPAYQKATTGG